MRPLLLAVLASLVAPAGALASGPAIVPVIPTGNSGADQYVESIPTATGHRSTTSIGGSGPSSARPSPVKLNGGAGSASSAVETSGVLAPATANQLARAGQDGRRAAALARAGAPAPVAKSVRSRGSGTGSHTSSAAAGPSDTGGSAVASVTRSLIGVNPAGGLGSLSLVLLAVAAGIVVLSVYRRRTNR